MSSADPDHEDCFKGEERLALFRPLGRQMRQGDPAELTIPDLLRITDALRSNDRTGAEAYLVLVGQTHHDLVQILFEWAIEWPNTCAQLAELTGERACTRRAFEIWCNGSESIRQTTEGDIAIKLVRSSRPHDFASGYQ